MKYEFTEEEISIYARFKRLSLIGDALNDGIINDDVVEKIMKESGVTREMILLAVDDFLALIEKKSSQESPKD